MGFFSNELCPDDVMLPSDASQRPVAFARFDGSVDSPIAAAHNYACYGESSPDIRAGYLPRDATTKAKDEGEGFLRCSISLPWLFRISPEKEIPYDHKTYQKNPSFCRSWHVRNKRVRNKYPKQQAQRCPFVAGAVRTHIFIGHRSKWSGTITSVTSAIRQSHSRFGSGRWPSGWPTGGDLILERCPPGPLVQV